MASTVLVHSFVCVWRLCYWGHSFDFVLPMTAPLNKAVAQRLFSESQAISSRLVLQPTVLELTTDVNYVVSKLFEVGKRNARKTPEKYGDGLAILFSSNSYITSPQNMYLFWLKCGICSGL